MTPEETVAAFFRAFYDRDWDRVGAFFGDDSVYWDVPLGPQAAAKGAAGVVSRLRGSIELLAGFADDHLRTVADGETVMTEHAEIWTWASGETVALPVASVHVVRDGVIVLWKDYWDFQTLMGAAPQAWLDAVATQDLSWRHDATGVR